MKKYFNIFRNQNTKLYAGLTIVLMLIFLLTHYHKLILNPGDKLMSAEGDGIKNYYVPMMQLKSNNVFQFSYFNYPYSEHFFYTDGFPLLVLLLKPVSLIYPGIYMHIPLIINLLIFLSMIACAWLIFLILKKLDVPSVVAMIFAVTITMMEPQLIRTKGHFTLAFCHVIPLSFWLVFSYITAPKKLRFAVFLLLHNVSVFLIHPYLGLMCTLLILPVMLLQILREKQTGNYKQWLYVFFASIFPALFYKSLTWITDYSHDRNTIPSGFHENKATFYTVFAPLESPFRKIFNLAEVFVSDNWENYAYVGLATSLFLLPALLMLIIAGIKKMTTSKEKTFIWGVLISGVLFLLFSMGYPFSGNNPDAIEKVPFLREFRSPGRFAWVFFYAATITIPFIFMRFFKAEKNKIVKYGLMVLFIAAVPFTYYYESQRLHKHVASYITINPNLFKTKHLDKDIQASLQSVNKDRYQAMMTLPVFYAGTEIYDELINPELVHYAMITSTHLDLPLIGNYSARASFSIAKKILQVGTSEYVYKEISQLFEDNKPVLLLAGHYLSAADAKLIERATPVSSNSKFRLFEIMPSDLYPYKQVSYEQWSSLITDSIDVAVGSTEGILFTANYDTLISDFSFFGKGAYQDLAVNYHHLYDFEQKELQPGQLYNASFWIYNYGNEHFFAKQSIFVFINRKDTLTGAVSWEHIRHAHKSVLSFNNWTLISMDFTISDSSNIYALVLKGHDQTTNYLYVDNLIIRDENAILTQSLNDSLFLVNNYIQRKDGKKFLYD